MMEIFDPTQRMKEVHEIHDTLCKIRAGKLDEAEEDYRHQAFDLNGFEDVLGDDDFTCYETVKIKGMSSKNSKQVMDPIQFIIDGGAGGGNSKKTGGNCGSKKQNKKNRKGKGKIV